MYAVVGCSDCRALWIVQDTPETTACPRCGTTRAFTDKKKLYTAEDPDAAREARARLVAQRRGHDSTYADMPDFAAMEQAASEAGPSDTEYLAGSDIDPTEVAAAGTRAGSNPGSSSRHEVVQNAVRDLEHPTTDAILAYASDRGVPEDAAREILQKLRSKGIVSETDGIYRML